MNRTGLVWGGIVIALLAIIFLPAGEHLLLGWLYFPIRVFPRITIDPAAVAMGLVSALLFFGGLHFLLTRLSSENGSSQAWPWRGTVVLSFLVMILFVAGISMVGAAHQIVWMFGSRAIDNSEQVFGVMDAARGAARKMQQTNNLKQIALGVQNFHDTFQTLPPGGTMTDDGELLHGWAIYIGPFLPVDSDAVDFTIPWNRPPNDRLFKCNFPMFVNPAMDGPYFDDQGFGLAHIAGNVHVLPVRALKREELRANETNYMLMRQLQESNQKFDMSTVTDGVSNTILIGTVAQGFKPWGHPVNVRDPARGINNSPDGFGGPVNWDGAMFSFCDGHISFMSNKIDPRVLRQLATPAGGEELDRAY